MVTFNAIDNTITFSDDSEWLSITPVEGVEYEDESKVDWVNEYKEVTKPRGPSMIDVYETLKQEWEESLGTMKVVECPFNGQISI